MELQSLFLGPLGAVFLTGVATVLLLWYSSRNHAYWKKRGIPFVKPIPIVGSILDQMLKPLFEVEQRRYYELGPLFGFFEGSKPVISVADPVLLRDILIKDFHIFPNRRSFANLSDIERHMVSILEGEDWKRVRTILTPTFSTGKLKRMIGIFKEGCQTAVQNYKRASEKKQFLNVKKIYGAMVMDIIASALFSTKIDSHSNPENKFAVMARQSFQNFNWTFTLLAMFPKLLKFFNIPVFDGESMKFFSDTTVEILKERKRLGQTRNDFLQLMLDTANEVKKEKKWENTEKESDLASNYGEEVAGQKLYLNSVTKNLSTDELVAQSVLFFMAGYETTAATLTFATYLLALNQDVQEKARQEIHDCVNETKGELTYEAIQKMKYLDNVISETLRIFPVGSSMERRTETDYKLGDTGITLPKGMIVRIPVYALHNDPKYYPEPEKFDPDRFTAEERAKRNPYVYLPFGAGPRNCVGMRFALLEMKVGLIHIINYFTIKPCPKTAIPLKFETGFLMTPQDIYLDMEIRNDSSALK